MRALEMPDVPVGTRLTLVLLLVLTPLALGYTYWSVQRSTKTYVDDLKRETCATSRGLASAIVNDMQAGEWDQISDVFTRLRADGTLAALFDVNNQFRFALPDFPRPLVPPQGIFQTAHSRGAAEFEQVAAHRHWFCRVVSLGGSNHQLLGYLLVAQDWSDINQDLRTRTLASIATAMLLMAVVATIIPLMIRRYVSRPLAELSEKVMRFSNDYEDRSRERNEVRLLTEEFRRLDQQLSEAHAALIEKHRRELALERRLQHADRLATIGTLASGLAHEIGTPMGVIRARAEYLLRNEPTSAKSAEGLDIIIRQIDRISRIVRMLLDYARGRKSIRITADVRPIVEHALRLVETEAARRNIHVTSQLGAVPLMVECEPDQLQQVFINLALNAFDAMTPEGGALLIAAEIAEEHEAPCVKLTFEDNGHGIPAEYSARIFDPFFTTKEPGKGTGMGLAVSQSIMRDHQSRITFESAAVGTRFFVTMPAIAPAVSSNGKNDSSVENRL
ncbi:MAG TPA: HAMP domain-containing sensor histidine kinase [Candidatus Binataceae bacterium]|nr:HAMP domain-containing sensor histidine kinase [Candidatus Binataceae bacterium]